MNESGNHRWIRIPPTERRGRTQTSVVSVAIIEPSNFTFKIDRNLVRKQYTRSSGKGGQNVNKRDTCVQLTDMKSGVQVKVQDFRTQKENEETAWIRLEEKIKEEKHKKWIQSIEKNRFEQIGLSKRSDKKRTYRIKEDQVVDHETNKNCSFKDFSRGRIELLS